MRSIVLLSFLLVASCVGTRPGTVPASTPVPAATAGPSGTPYQAPDFHGVFPAAIAGAWQPQEVLVPRGATPIPAPGLPAEAEQPYHFVGPHDLAVPVGNSLRLQLTDGCGEVYWGVLDPATATITADGTVTPRRPGPVLAFAQQNGRRRYVQVAALDPAVAARRFGPPAGWTLRLTHDRVDVATSPDAFAAIWREAVVSTRSYFGGFGSPEPEGSPPPPPDIDFARYAVLAIAMTVSDDEGDPVITHVDAAGIHVALPDDPTGSAQQGREVVAFFRVPTRSPATLVDVSRHDPRRPLPALPAGPTPAPTPAPTRGPGDCPPAWAWDGIAPPLWLDATEGGTDAQGFVFPPAPLLALASGKELTLVARSASGEPTWRASGTTPGSAVVEPGFGVPMAYSPNGPSPPPGLPFSATVHLPGPGTYTITAQAGAAMARALVVQPPDPPAGLVFRFAKPLPAAELPGGLRVLADAASWQAFWHQAYPTLEAPEVDFGTYDVLAYVDDRVTYGERGAPVLMAVEPEVQLAFPAVETAKAVPVRRRDVTLFLTGKLPAHPKLKRITICSP